ncbi:hypothetical protein ACFSSB_00660 [Lacinutrix gracilariae]|uniref:Uncharacterized protein n=1 Tax=Lacinutrix gracilariae TaxID=1747198 RepID=A0ABW5JWJ9_9FLAO
MSEFLLKYASLCLLGLEILAAVIGLLLYSKYKHTAAKYFIYFLVYVVFIVIIGRYTWLVKEGGAFSFLLGTLLERNYWFGTITWKIGAVSFFGWYYLKILKNNTQKKILRISLILFIVASVLIILLTLPNFFVTSIPSISILGALIILQCSFYYFMEILQSEKILTFYKSLNFYISCVILLFWLVKTPLVFYEQYYRIIDMDYVYLRGIINLFVISFMYITYAVGLIVSKPEYD